MKSGMGSVVELPGSAIPSAASTEPAAAEVRSVSTEEKMVLLGEATYLFLNSPLHLRYAVHQLSTFILTPLRLGQYRMYRSARGPVGFVAWAFLTERAAADYVDGRRELTPQDWNAGDQLWFIEFLAPFGHSRRIVADLRANVFATASARSLHRFIDGRDPVVRNWHGLKVVRR